LAACMNTRVTTTVASDPFNEALHKGYAAFAASERAQYDWIDGEYFANKSNAAAAGQRVLPELVSNWSLSKAKADELGAARARLMSVLDGGARTAFPADAAEAQVAFDCWIEQEEEGWQVADIKACKDRFEAAMLRMGGGVANVYLVFFDFDRSNISPVAQRVLEKVVADAARMNPSRITVAGHAAGGHLAAMLLACDWTAVAPDLPAQLVRNALSISGLYDLRPLQRAPFIADAIRLSDADALRLSPALWPAPKRGRLYTVAGGEESEEFIRHNALIREVWGPKVVPVCEALPGLDHFGVVDALADPGQRLHGLAVQLIDT